MRKQALLGLLGLLGMCCTAMAVVEVVDDRPVAAEKSPAKRTAADLPGPSDELVILDDAPTMPSDMVTVELDADMVFERVVVGPDGKVSVGGAEDGSVAGPGEHLIYENILGIDAVNFPQNQPVSDDISTIAPDDCNLTRFKFKVLGRVQTTCVGGANNGLPCTTPGECPSGTCPRSGAYSVSYALYSNCPLAVGATDEARAPVRIVGTEGFIEFPDDAPREVTHTVNPLTPVALPTNVYLGIQFNRPNCGTVVGAPATLGFSGDIWDSPGHACKSFLNGFPASPHASFWLQMWGSTNCPPAFAGYKCQRPSGGYTTIGANIQGVDDVKLIVDDCDMIGYEVAVRGIGFYTFDLRRACDGQIIAGTEKTYQIGAGEVPNLQIARFTFNPPIHLPSSNIFVGFTCSANGAGAVIAGVQPIIGESDPTYFSIGQEGCAEVSVPPGVHGAVNLAITCAGELPEGACCDPYLTECNAGADLGKRCKTSAACAPPGTCEAVCRQTSDLNCPFPPTGQELFPLWRPGDSCEPDPFPEACGKAACCHMRPDPQSPGNLEEVCEDYTKNECDAALPADRARLWQLGQYCGLNLQSCPRNACLARDGSCYSPHTTPGCSDPFCCDDICAMGALGAFCCNTAWDAACVQLAEAECVQAPPNDQCAPDFPVPNFEGAVVIPFPGSRTTSNIKATEYFAEPGYCCNNGVGSCTCSAPSCLPFVGLPCVEEDEEAVCGDNGNCSPRTPNPGGIGQGSIWFKFTTSPGICSGGSTPGAPCSTAANCTGFVCVGGANVGLACAVAGDCPGGSCPGNGTCNGGATNAGVGTCTSNAPALDSILQVYKAGDHSSPLNECDSLSVIGCADDTQSCSSTQRNSRVCLRNLTPGETYYVQVASKTDHRRGSYTVSISTSCSGPTNDPVINDYCQKATPITDPTPADPLVIPFNLGAGCVGGANPGQTCTTNANCRVCVGGSNPGAQCTSNGQCNSGGTCPAGGTCQTGGATFECPADQCVPSAQNDMWWNYTATCTGEATITTCGGNNPDTNLAVYEGCTNCPPNSGNPIGCNDDYFQDGCNEASRVVVPVEVGQCYKIRLADQEGEPVAGNLTITCSGGDCQPNGTPDEQDIANCPPGTGPVDCQDCNGNGRPDFCDIRDLVEPDCQANGIPDSCELADNDCQPNGIPDDCDGGCPNDCSGFVSSVPTNCSVDARRPHLPGPGAAQGTNSIAMTFGAPCDAAPADFTITCVNGNIAPPPPCPTISDVSGVGVTQTITLSGVIPAGSWTCVTHTSSGAEVCVGSLPGDCDGNKFTAAADILKLIDHLNGVAVPPLALDHCDMDRLGTCVPADLLSLIDMLNGANGYISWTGKTLPACPNP